MNNSPRVYNFQGNDAEYILFLEDRLTRALSLLHQSPQSQHALSLLSQFHQSPPHEPIRLLAQNPGHQPGLPSCHQQQHLEFVEYVYTSKRRRRNSDAPNARAVTAGGKVQELASDTPEGNSTTVTTVKEEHSDTIPTETLQSEWFTTLNRFIDDFTTADNWHKARQNAGLYSSTENDIVISILIDDYDKAGISFLLERHKEAAISSLRANKSIHDGNTYRKPTEHRSRNPAELIEAYCISTEEIEKLGDSLASSVELHHLITKISLFKDLIYGTFCRLLELEGTDKKEVDSFMAKRFSYSAKYLYHLRLCCGWVVQMISELQNETKSKTGAGWGNRISEGFFLGTAYFHFE